MARSTVAQRVQIGKETTAGTPVPANRSLGSLSIMLSPAVETTNFRARGNKYNTIVSPNKEWVAVSAEGMPTYEELVYPLSSVLGQAVITPSLDGATPQTGAYDWLFEPKTSGADTPAIYTVEQGDTGQSERASHVLFSDWSMEVTRAEASVSAEGMGQRLDKNATLTAGATPASADLTPILPGQFCIYAADNPADLGLEANRQGTALSITPSIGGRFSPVWYLNCTQNSFGTFVEGAEPEFTLEYATEANANGMAWLDTFRAAQTRFIRVEAEGPIIDGTTVPYLLQMDFAVKVSNPGETGDEDGIYRIAPTMEVVHDPTWGRAARFLVRSSLAAL